MSTSRERKVELSVEITLQVRLDHLLYTPEKAETGPPWPLVVFLHGAGERGDDLSTLRAHGLPKRVAEGHSFPFAIASPQCEPGRFWQPEAVLRFIDSVCETVPVDPDRIYLTGISMGGYGTWATATEDPDRFAAVAPICGGGDPRLAHRLAGLPIWVFHGAEDKTISPRQSETMIDALEEIGSPARYTLYPDLGHDCWTVTYENPELYDWLLSHRRSHRGKR